MMTLNPTSLGPLYTELKDANKKFDRRYPQQARVWQALHTFYGGASLYKENTYDKINQLALQSFEKYAPDVDEFARALDLCTSNYSYETSAAAFSEEACALLYSKVLNQLRQGALQDHRIDFEDGYGYRPSEEEDEDALRCAEILASHCGRNSGPKGVGLRVKALTNECMDRSVRTLDIFLTTLLRNLNGQLPENFVVTLPKVNLVEQVNFLNQILKDIERAYDLTEGAIKTEIIVESAQASVNVEGRCPVGDFIDASFGRCKSVVIGTYDYTASCAITSIYQDHRHPSVDGLRLQLINALSGRPVSLCDSVTIEMPVAKYKSNESELSPQQLDENKELIQRAWKRHFDNINHSLYMGFYQGWDLHPAQIPIRYSAIYRFFMLGMTDSLARLKGFQQQASQATLTGNTFDDAASAHGLVNFFNKGLSCGAFSKEDLRDQGLDVSILEAGAFQRFAQSS